MFRFKTLPKRYHSLAGIHESWMLYFLLVPQYFEDTIKKEVLRKAMNEEVRSIEKNHTL